jgi:hypothetical protein
MKLDELHVAKKRAGAVTERETVSSCNRRIGCFTVYLSGSSGRDKSGSRNGFEKFSLARISHTACATAVEYQFLDEREGDDCDRAEIPHARR